MTKQVTDRSLTKKGINGAFWQTSASLIRILVQFILLAVLGRLITPTEFGYIAFIMILVGFTDMFSRMGIGGALIQLDNVTTSHIKTGYTLSLVFGIALGMVFYFITPTIALFFEMDELKSALHFFAFLFPIKSINSVSLALLNRELRFALTEKIQLISFVLGYGLISIMFAFLGFGYWSLLYGQLAMTLISLFHSCLYHFPIFSFKWVKKEIKQLLFFGSGYTLNSFIGYFSDTIDNLMVSKFMGPQALGFYSKSYQLYVIPASILGSVYDKVMFPILSKRKDDLEKLRDFYFFSVSLCILILMPIGIFIFLNSKIIIDIVLGPNWQESIIILQILILSLPFRFGYRINRSFLTAMGLVYKCTFFEFVFFINVCVFGGLGLFLFNLPGLAVGVLLSSIIFFLNASVYLSKLLKVSRQLNLSLIYNFLTFNIPIFLLCLLMVFYFKFSSWILLGISIFLFPIFIILLFFFKKSIILTPSNIIIKNQVISNLPLKIQKIIETFHLKLYKITSRFKL